MQLAVRVQHLREAFRARLCEWAFACILLLWGVALILPTQTFDGAVYAAFRGAISEENMAYLMMGGGFVRLGVLAANGSYRPMYYVRAWMALSSMVIWTAIGLGFYSSGVVGTWIAFYPVLIVFDAVNVFRAMSDAAAAEIAARSVRTAVGGQGAVHSAPTDPS